MRELASKQQLRWAFLRWAMLTVPFVLLLGFLSARSVPTGGESRWYSALAKPGLTPPDWVFPIAWSTLYVLMGIALAMIIHARGSRGRGIALAAFAVQLLLNLAWTPVFFGMHLVGSALVLIVAMFATALATAMLFGRIRALAALLLVPYLGWILFAGYLNYQINLLNPNAETLVPGASSTQILR